MKPRHRAFVIWLLIAGSVTALGAWTQPWFYFILSGAAAQSVEVSGSQARPLVSGLAFVILSSIVVCMLSTHRLRLVLLGVVLASSITGVVVCSTALGEPVAASFAPLANVTGLGSMDAVTDSISESAVSPWPIVSLVSFLVCTVGALVGLATSRRWPHTGRRYERSSRKPGGQPVGLPAAGDTQTDTWETLSHGQDPTAS